MAIVAGGAALLFVGAAYAITDTAFIYSSPQTASLALHNSAFSTDGFTTTNFRNHPADGATSTTGTACAGAGVNLPQGAIITNVVIWAESTAMSLPTFEILRRKASDNALDAVAGGTFQDTSGVRQSQTIGVTSANATINNNAYAYAARICVGPASTFYQARVTYTYKRAGD